MIEGRPLQYYPLTTFAPPQFPFFRRFESHIGTEMNEELFLPTSPRSTHSDSDNSLSSTDATNRPTLLCDSGKTSRAAPEKESITRCCWKSCGIVFESLDELATHVTKVHASSGLDGLFYCGWEGCTRNDRGFNARYKMLVHVRTHTNEKPHKCDKCDKSFSRAENLKIHSRSHSGEKPYICPVPGCNKAYSNSSDRFKHTRTHQVEKPYKCKVPGCPKRYTDPSSLRKHVKTYKHFPNENTGKIEEVVMKTTPAMPEKIDDSEVKSYQPLTIMHPCTCMQSCCISSNLSKSIRFDAYIGFKDEIKSWEKFVPESSKIYTQYDLKSEAMDIDVPLDLSINSKKLS